MINEKLKRVMIIDGTNIFLRSYVINPTLSRNGEPCGGLFGSLQSLQKFVRESSPNVIIWTWDGVSGSKRRKQADKNYKFGRKPVKLNWDSGMDENQKYANKNWQMCRLTEYLSDLPIYQLVYDNVEADDVISYCCQHEKFKDWFKVIVSSDKDFIQLLNNRTVLFRPTQKEVLTVKRIVEEYQIHPNNFLLARAMCGDKSDNLEGVAGLGLSTAAKRFPFLKEERQYFIADVLEACKNAEDKKIKCYQNLLAEEGKIRHNYGIMQLSQSQFSVQDKESINKELQKKLNFGRSNFVIRLTTDQLPVWSWETLFAVANRIVEEQ